MQGTRRSGTQVRIVSSIFAVLLALQAAGNPRRVMAQQAPAAQPAANSEAIYEKETAKEEEKGDNVYRHSAVVKAAARLLHLSPETTARGFEIINFAVIALGLGIPLVRIVPKYLRGRREKLSADLESARKQTADANSRLSAVEEKLKHLDEEIAKYRAQVEEEMRGDEMRIKAALEEESARIVAAAEQEISVAAAQARRGLKRFAAELAVGNAASQMVLTPETDRALIAEFVSNAGKGGTN